MCVPVGPRRVWREALARTSTDKKRPAWGLVGARLPHARPPPLDVAAERVRPEWMREWISNPNRLFPYNQLMPQNFANDQKEKKYGKEISIDRDDFVLRTDKDGEKAKPFVGSQIAGREALIVTRTEDASNKHHPGISIGGMGGGVGTGSGSDNGAATSKIQNAATVKENPLQKVLDDKVLVEGKTKSPLSGLLYFPMEKQKMKELELYYGGKENRISLRFK